MTNIEFEWWWMLFLLPLPIVFRWLTKPVKPKAAVRLTYLPPDEGAIQSKSLPVVIITSLVWLCLILAAARPVWFGDPISAQPKHRDMMLVVDLSYSMSQKDMQDGDDYIDRLSAVKNVLNDFIDKRKGDRLGLVLFADHAYLQTPLTFDRNTVKQQLDQTVLKLIGNNTAIGEGIGLATKTFIDGNAPQRVMILLSDGSNTAGVLDPIKAAEIAKKYHTKIYTIGVGAGEMLVQDFFMTRKINTAADLDEKTLMKIAKITGGQYFRARNKKELETIYDTINSLQPVQQAKQTWRPQDEWFPYPLALALFGSLILLVLRRSHV
ncbi:VWA domain-containing protein [Vibrio sp.]|uniref:VWA domain-containing protein n=1 Tax=Vibrio viridaestus TaxID=2487322 RepID=A0A3N9TLH1_9VIBR|nr:VWA domain-containing protein [Vibrio viridaestus]MDC0610567.1 VWA domain-containing protein [Vibrio sp.]RQW65127.1 VWA domain-containing protein [Vibrio viridaestus]